MVELSLDSLCHPLYLAGAQVHALPSDQVLSCLCEKSLLELLPLWEHFDHGALQVQVRIGAHDNREKEANRQGYTPDAREHLHDT